MRLTTALLIAAGTALHAQSFTGTYTFGANGNVSSFAYNGTDIANLTVGAIVKSAGITSSSSSGNFRANNWTMDNDIDAGDYIGFSLTAAEGYEIDMSSISFGIARSSTGTRNWVWRSSLDSFASNLAVYDTVPTGVTNTSGVLNPPDNTNTYNLVLNLGALANVSTIEFRLYSYSAEASGGTAGLAGPLTFAGSLISTTPPPQDAGTGLYWAGSGSGGSGTWTAAGTTFATDATFATSGLAVGSGTVVFAGTAGTVTLGEAISVASGLQFVTTGYTVESSTLTLAGASIGANTLTVDSGVATTVTSAIDGTAGLTKSGAGTLTLSGANTYTGGTSVALGALVGSAASIRGDLANNGSVTLVEASDATFSGAISGTGSLTKDGAGTLTLSGANTYSGGTTVSAGALKGDTTSIQRAITNNAAVIFDQASAGTHTGAISGTGSVTKLGAGTLTLSGSNSYSGGTTVSAGSLVGSTASIQGAITNDAAVTFSQSSAGTYAGIMSGTGSLTKDGSGAVTLTGANTYSGGTTVTAGTLVGTTTSLQRDITNNASLVFSQADDGAYAGAISGSGAVAKSGAGVVTLSGANSFTGGLSVTGGAIRLASAAAAPSSGAILLNGGGLLVDGSVNLTRAVTIGAAGGLFISEYLESGSQKYIEIYNATGATVDLSGYEIALYTNGALSAGTTSVLSGSLAADGVAVYRNSGSNLVLANGVTATTLGAVNFNGDDAVALRAVGGSVIDVVGVIGNDPGTSWVSNGVKTEDGTIVRSDTVTVGNPNGTLQSLGSEWTFSATVDGSGLGSHTLSGGGEGTGSGTLGIAEAGAATFSGNVTLHGAATLTAAASGTATFSGVLSGGGSVTKAGEGLVVLSSANTYTGGTTVSAGTLRLGDLAALGTGNVAVSGGILDLNNLVPTNVIVVSGGSLLNASAWAALGAVQLTGNVGSEQINNLGADITEVKIAAGATVNLAGVTKDIVFEGGTLTNLADFGTGRKIKVKGALDVSGGDHGGELEIAAGGALDFGNRASNRTVKFSGGAITGANFTGTVDVDSAAGSVDLTSSIGAGNVRLGNGASAAIQAGFNRALRLESGATLSGLGNYSGELTVAAPTFSTTGITTSATIAIESGSKLTGSGTVGSVVQAAGSTLAPGNSPGLLTTGSAVLAGGASMEVEFINASGVRGTDYDAVTVTGVLDLSGLSTAHRYTLNLISLSALPSTQGALAGFDGSTAYIYELFTYATVTLPASYTGSIADLFTIDTASFDDSTGNSVTGSWTVFNNTGTNTLELQYAPIPEPSTYGLILGGLALAGAAIRRRRAKRA